MRPRRDGALPAERLPLILEVAPNADYALVDSGDGRKLERYGPYTIVRPEGQAIWRPALSERDWARADAVFTGDTDEEGMGRWRFPKAPLGETWPMRHDGIDYLGRFTSFRHVGVFPEQATHWRHMEELIRGAKRPVKVLNLFGYTGLASLVAARAGAEVTHVDASKKAVGWARENAALNGANARIVEGDIAAGFRALDLPPFDWAISNPPFFDDPGALRAPAPGKRGAWMADDGLKAWTGFLLKAVREGGRIVVIHRADRLADLLGLLGDIDSVQRNTLRQGGTGENRARKSSPRLARRRRPAQW